MPTCHRVRKPIKVGLDWRQPGELVPEAKAWKGHVLYRMEATQFVELTPCTEDELFDALSYCPELYPAYGITPVEVVGPPEPLDILTEAPDDAPANDEVLEQEAPAEEPSLIEAVRPIATKKTAKKA